MKFHRRRSLFRPFIEYGRQSSNFSPVRRAKPEYTAWPPLQRLENPSLGQFRAKAFEPSLPHHLASTFNLPASTLWIDSINPSKINDQCFMRYARTLRLDMELIATSLQTNFTRRQSYLEIFLDYMKMVQDLHIDGSTSRLYIAQASLDLLPNELKKDVPTPSFVLEAGRGDLYKSSLWMGPSFVARTPLHNDPNPNILVQIAGSKAVRLLPPKIGEGYLDNVKKRISPRYPESPSRMLNGTEMIRRGEFLDQVIWHEDNIPDGACEAILKPGDGIFIPTGWWHSIRGIDNDIDINISVNWWFR